jgi:hypothetical protein
MAGFGVEKLADAVRRGEPFLSNLLGECRPDFGPWFRVGPPYLAASVCGRWVVERSDETAEIELVGLGAGERVAIAKDLLGNHSFQFSPNASHLAWIAKASGSSSWDLYVVVGGQRRCAAKDIGSDCHLRWISDEALVVLRPEDAALLLVPAIRGLPRALSRLSDKKGLGLRCTETRSIVGVSYKSRAGAGVAQINVKTGEVMRRTMLPSAPEAFALNASGVLVWMDRQHRLSIRKMGEEGRTICVAGVQVDPQSLPQAGWTGDTILLTRTHQNGVEVLELDVSLALA